MNNILTLCNRPQWIFWFLHAWSSIVIWCYDSSFIIVKVHVYFVGILGKWFTRNSIIILFWCSSCHICLLKLLFRSMCTLNWSRNCFINLWYMIFGILLINQPKIIFIKLINPFIVKKVIYFLQNKFMATIIAHSFLELTITAWALHYLVINCKPLKLFSINLVKWVQTWSLPLICRGYTLVSLRSNKLISIETCAISCVLIMFKTRKLIWYVITDHVSCLNWASFTIIRTKWSFHGN